MDTTALTIALALLPLALTYLTWYLVSEARIERTEKANLHRRLNAGFEKDLPREVVRTSSGQTIIQ